jgi:hypothetical protein
MADFCQQCSATIFGAEAGQNDFVGLSTEENTKKGLFPVVLCEGCGPIQVDHTGRCVSVDCLKKHGEKKDD